MGFYEENPNVFDLTKVESQSKIDEKGRKYKICPHCKERFYRDAMIEQLNETRERNGKKVDHPYTNSFIENIWIKKRYCSEKCRDEYWDGFDKSMTKICELCGRKYYRPRIVSLQTWNTTRKYCDKKCHDEAFHILKLSEFMNVDFDDLKKKIIKAYEELIEEGKT